MELRRGLAQTQLDVAQLVAGALELGREPLERRDRPLCDAGQAGSALALLGRQRLRGGRRRLGELDEVAKPLAVVAEPLLVALLEPVGVLCECL